MSDEQNFFHTFLDEAEDNLQTWESLCLSLDKSIQQSDLDALFRVAHNLKGSSKSVGCLDFGDFVHSVEDFITELKKGETSWDPSVASLLFQSHGLLTTWLQGLRTDIKFVPDTSSIQSLLKARSKPKSPSITGFTSFEDDQEAATPDAPGKSAKGAMPSVPAPTESAEKDQKARSPASDTIRISKTKIDLLQQLIGELTSARAIIAQSHKLKDYNTKAFDDAQSLLDATVRDLQIVTLNLKSQSVEGLFQRLERVARDIARDLNKEVKIHLEGEETEMDRIVIEKVTEPLVHVMRNAVDHGLESTAVRIANQKPEFGTITVSASTSASFVSIKIRDDGAGLNPEGIRKKAIEKGLITAQQSFTVEQAQALILLPGFSTAEKLTKISGRGVGLDIVKTTVEAMGGQLHMCSSQGQGTTFELLIPVTLSIIDALVFTIDESPYAVPLNSLAEVLELSSHTIKKASINERTVKVRNELMPLHELGDHLEHQAQALGARPSAAADEARVALVAQSQGHSIAFRVDRIIGKQTVVVRPLMPSMEHQTGIIGTTILASGLPALIISLTEFAQGHLSPSQGSIAL